HRRERIMGAAMLPAQPQPVIEIPGPCVSQLMDGYVEEASIYIAACSSRARLDHGSQKTKRSSKPGGLIDHGRGADPGRRAFRLAREMHQARLCLHQIVVARPGGARSVAPVSR